VIVKFVGLNVNVRIYANMSVRLYRMAALCRTQNVECVKGFYVRNYLSGNFEMKGGVWEEAVCLSMCDEHRVAVQHWATCVGS
jgi:hypothetical protein